MIPPFVAALSKRVPGGRWATLALLFALLIVADYGWLGVSRIVDQRGGDILLRLHAATRPPSSDVVIIDIDQRSLEQMNDLAGSWPWPRSVHGELVDYLEKQHPKAIVFDILFNELDVFRPEHDAAFADAVARHSNVYVATALASNGRGAPAGRLPAAIRAMPLPNADREIHIPLLLPLVLLPHPETMRGGLINLNTDSDRVGRRMDLYRDRSGWRFASLAGRLAEDFGWRRPPGQSILLNWRAGWTHVSYADLYLDSQRQHPLRPSQEFRGKVLIIGTAAPGLQDLRVTPLGNSYPGVQMLATGIDNLRRGDWLRDVPRTRTLPLAAGMVGSIAFGFARRWNASFIVAALAATTAVVLLFAWLQLGNGTMWPVFAPLTWAWAFTIGSGSLAYLQERAQRQRTVGMFQRFLDPRVVAELVERGEIDDRANAQSRSLTVLFSDIRGFTTLSETNSPADVVTLLNRYFSRQVDVIFKHGGTLDKFIGDAIMAFWGAPVSNPDHAAAAIAAALEMSLTLEQLRSELGEIGRNLDVGIGLHTGDAVVSFIGATSRLDYTVIGDTVNLASRIEGLTKGIARILVSDATRSAAGEAFDYVDRGLHSVKGREQQVRLYEPRQKYSKNVP